MNEPLAGSPGRNGCRCGPHRPRRFRTRAGSQRTGRSASFGSCLVVPRRQVVVDFSDLLFDEVVIIEQPFRGGHHAASALDLRGACAIGLKQDRRIVVEPVTQRGYAGWAQGDWLRCSQRRRMVLEPIDAKQFSSDGLSVGPDHRRIAEAEQASKDERAPGPFSTSARTRSAPRVAKGKTSFSTRACLSGRCAGGPEPFDVQRERPSADGQARHDGTIRMRKDAAETSSCRAVEHMGRLS